MQAGWWDSDIAWSFRHSPVTVVSAVVFAASFGVGRAAAPTDPPTTEAPTSSTTAADHEGHAP